MENQQMPVKDRRNKLFSHLLFYFAKLLLLVCSATCFQWCLWTQGDGAPAPADSIPATRAGLPQDIKQWCLNWCSVAVASNRRHRHLPCPLGMDVVGWSIHLLCKTLHRLSPSAAVPGKIFHWHLMTKSNQSRHLCLKSLSSSLARNSACYQLLWSSSPW